MWITKTGKVTDNTYMLGTVKNPVYLIRQNGTWILVEGGLSMHFELVKHQLREIIADLSQLQYWFITHSHYDHCGLLEYLYPDLPAVTVYASEKAIQNFCNRKWVHSVRKLNEQAAQLNGTTLPIQDKITSLSLIPYKKIGNDDVIKTGDEEWETIAAPGHSECSVAFYTKKGKQLFASDAFGEMISVKDWFPLPFHSMSAYVISIVSLNEKEVNGIYLGHHGILTDEEAYDAGFYTLQNCSKKMDFIHELLQNHSEQEVARKLTADYGPHSAGFIPAIVYEKSMIKLIHTLKEESFLPKWTLSQQN